MTYINEDNIHRLILGTVQFGLAYGISNRQGQLTQQEVNAVLAKASEAGLTTLDTAAAYGESEASIGTSIRETRHDFRVISKYPPYKPGLPVAKAFQESLDRLGKKDIYAYLLHSYSSYSRNPEIITELQKLKESGRVKKIGISLYHPEEAYELLEKEEDIDIIQFPYSVFDRRFEKVLTLLRHRNIETHARSVFLQGLYFMAPDALPAKLSPVAPKIAGLQELATHYGLPLGAMLLGFALANPFITHVVMGVESLETLQENLGYRNTRLSQNLMQELQSYQEDNGDVLLPYKWSAI